MGCKITKTLSRQQGLEDYYMDTSDFGSLQMRLTTQDTMIDSADHMPDKGLYEIYNEHSECPDAHSGTGRVCFVDSVQGKLYVYSTDQGELKLYQDTNVDGKKSQDLKEGDMIHGKKILAVVSRPMTTKEFKTFTKDNYVEEFEDDRFAGWRQASKTVNFGVLFNCTAPTLAKSLEKNGYKEEEAWAYITLTHNEQRYYTLLQEMKGKMTPKKCKYLMAGTLLLEAYYKAYPGIPQRITREIENAWITGVSQMWGGSVRHLPELKYIKRGEDGGAVGADKLMYSSMISNRQNQAANAPIQAMEARVAMATFHNVFYYLKEWGLKSKFFNTVHDSGDYYIWKPELDLVLALLNECSQWIREPDMGVHMCMDHTVCDPAKGKQHNYYKGGIENPFKVMPLEQALKEYNEANGTNLKWHGCTI